MNGQWMGSYSGSNNGILVVDLDDMGSHFEGYAYAYDDNSSLPSTYVQIKTTGKKASANLKVVVFPIDPRTGEAGIWENLVAIYPNATFPKNADVKISLKKNILKVEWKTDIGTSGTAKLPRTKAHTPTEYEPLSNITTWEKFKTYVNKLEHRRYVFRGQREAKRLRTTFHRTGRADLYRFISSDIKVLHRHLSLRTSHIFNLKEPDENGSFFNLVQHHGYPTPLLDWTYSPFVGAFFAYRKAMSSISDSNNPSKKVRIFLFDHKQWCLDVTPQVPKLVGKPHFSFMEFIAIDNERHIPQQSISSLTNVDDIESYVQKMEKPEKKYLQIIDLPLKERPRVMKDLSSMGITAGSLFPGLDGTCEELKERFFSV